MFFSALSLFILAARVATFPFAPPVLPSPDRLWQITNVDPQGEDLSHRLILKGRDGAERTLYSYGRSVRVAWSPDSRRVAITDYEGSNVAECLVIDVVSLKKTDVVSDAVRHSNRVAHIMRNFHSYFECLGWASDNELNIKVHGYGDADPEGASYETKYALRGAPD